ncbi:hypothetical protein [Risungbinella massiliensis]|uniref:hypothetical protein n=1 Tax=Risungbinella massiliensis TaxID=1329796 RepID=UPI0005CB845D|nr:hypothetical protein [Risungbinella massiliensis]
MKQLENKPLNIAEIGDIQMYLNKLEQKVADYNNIEPDEVYLLYLVFKVSDLYKLERSIELSDLVHKLLFKCI